MKKITFQLMAVMLLINMNSCAQRNERTTAVEESADTLDIFYTEEYEALPGVENIVIEKDFIYDKKILDDTYKYKKGKRSFQWDKIKDGIAHIDSIQYHPTSWGVISNRRNKNGEGPVVKSYKRNAYNRISDDYGVERYQSAPLYHPSDSARPERYGRDGTLVKYIEAGDEFSRVRGTNFSGEWLIPNKYLKPIHDTIVFTKVIFIDKTNQNIAALEKVGNKWLVRSMDHATTGVHNPPYQHETPTGIFVIQEKKNKMYYYKDGTKEIGGFAPYASRFCNGAYIHGVPVNKPRTKIIERSKTLGTVPRSHMCVRNASSHAKFIYDWAPVEQALVCVIE